MASSLSPRPKLRRCDPEEAAMLAIAVASGVLAALLFLPFYLLRWSRGARLTRHLPGPEPLPIVGSALEFGKGPVEIMENTVRLWRQYGNVFKLWMGPELFVFLADPRYLEEFLTCTVNTSKGLQYNFLHPWLGTGLLTSGGRKWKEHRRMLTPAFHFKILEQFVETFHSNTDILLKNLKVHLDGPVFDIHEYITLYALDVICETTFGVHIHAQENRQSEYVTAVKGMSKVLMQRAFNPVLFLDAIFNYTAAGREHRRHLSILHKATREVIKKRKLEHSLSTEFTSDARDGVGIRKKLALLDILLASARDGENLTDEDIREEVDTFMFEGHDTTASAMSFCLWLLAKHLDIQGKVYDELQEIFGNSNRRSTLRDLQDMKYLECVIKESLRLFPSVPFYGRKLNQDVKIGDLHLPAGTNIAFLVYCLHRNPDIYPDPERFDPNRFSAENSSRRHPFAFLPFSAGPRNCIGQKFAMLEMKAMISEVLRQYKLFASQEEKMVISWDIVLKSPRGVFLTIEPRV